MKEDFHQFKNAFEASSTLYDSVSSEVPDLSPDELKSYQLWLEEINAVYSDESAMTKNTKVLEAAETEIKNLDSLEVLDAPTIRRLKILAAMKDHYSKERSMLAAERDEV